MAVLDVYFLALHEPYQAAEHPVPINATMVHARTLLHRGVPQPVGGLMYRCLTEFPGRRPGCVVPLSTLTYELNGGDGWDRIGDWTAVVDALVRLSRERRCDAMPLGLPNVAAGLLAHGPTTNLTVFNVGAAEAEAGPVQRQHQLDQLTDAVRAYAAQGPFWPGDNLISPPREPAILPYHPRNPATR
ncbi:hypothetical protein [Micromonospora aurantiaca (nom. illeg.)]|uniref:hypothetical protein n=1 Tax=Micromonospora aurantiaca (nom. illeg.) TaxID=47850 RepID=UPI00340ABE0D